MKKRTLIGMLSRRVLTSLLCAAMPLPLLASCGGDGGGGKVSTPPPTTTTAQLVDFSEQPGMDSLLGITEPYATNQRLFESGGRVHYRIPGLFVLNDGTLISVIVQRVDTVADNSPEKQVVVRRSTDGGLTWSEDTYLNYLDNYCVDYGGGVYDAKNDTLLLFLSTKTSTTAAKEHYNSLPAAERPYRGTYIMKTTDGGLTWEMVIPTLVPDESGFLPNQITGNFDGGKQILAGPYEGRLVTGARELLGDLPKGFDCLLYSDDGGLTWHMGARMPFNTGECVVAALPDGSIYVNSRTYNNDGLRIAARSYDGGVTFAELGSAPDLVEPAFGCNSGICTFRHPETGETVMLYVGINNFQPGISTTSITRYNISVWISYDEGRTWPVCKTIDPDRSAYSSIVYNAETNLIHILYETGHDELYDRGANLFTCNLAWLESPDAPLPAYTLARPAGTWQEKAASSFAGGSGTAEDPYLVATAEQLALIARLTNCGQTLAGVYFRQTADIDLGACAWTPIGHASSRATVYVDYDLPNAPFSGNYDGGGFVIRNLSANMLQRSGVGLFGYVQNATVRNVFVDNGYVHGAIESTGVVGLVAYRDSTLLENCFFRGEIYYDFPTVEAHSRGLIDAGYRDGAPAAGDLTVFSSLSVTESPRQLPPASDQMLSWRFRAADSYAGGDGSEQTPYLIETAEQLARLAREVNAGESYAGVYFCITADIDLSGTNWDPIGYATFADKNHINPTAPARSFMGTLDGGGHTVSGVCVQSKLSGAGFFGYLCGGTVRNLAVKGTVTGQCAVGGFVGFLRPNATSPTTIENCFFEGSVITPHTNVGGFIGRIHQTSGCVGESDNDPAYGLLRNNYCKAILAADVTHVTVTLFFGGQYNDRASWTVINCNAVNDLPENAEATLYRSGCSAANGISSAAYDAAYAAFCGGQ